MINTAAIEGQRRKLYRRETLMLVNSIWNPRTNPRMNQRRLKHWRNEFVKAAHKWQAFTLRYDGEVAP